MACPPDDDDSVVPGAGQREPDRSSILNTWDQILGHRALWQRCPSSASDFEAEKCGRVCVEAMESLLVPSAFITDTFVVPRAGT